MPPRKGAWQPQRLRYKGYGTGRDGTGRDGREGEGQRGTVKLLFLPPAFSAANLMKPLSVCRSASVRNTLQSNRLKVGLIWKNSIRE